MPPRSEESAPSSLPPTSPKPMMKPPLSPAPVKNRRRNKGKKSFCMIIFLCLVVAGMNFPIVLLVHVVELQAEEQDEPQPPQYHEESSEKTTTRSEIISDDYHPEEQEEDHLSEQLLDQISFNQTTNTRRKVEFVHITKTGGTALEATAADAGITWGYCHYARDRGVDAYLHCPEGGGDFSSKPHTLDINKVAFPNFHRDKIVWTQWHTPPHWFEQNPFDADADTFVIVRNPYERILSEFNCPWEGYKGNKTDAPVMNAWLKEKILNVAENGTLHHLLPQHFYVYDKDDNLVVNEILRFESYTDDVMRLSNQYNLGLTIPTKRNAGLNHSSGEKKLTVSDFDHETICMINEFYRVDFERFGYTMIEEKNCEEQVEVVKKLSSSKK